MLSSTLVVAALSALAFAQEEATGKLGDAIENLNNPPATVYQAIFDQPKSNVRGVVVASSVGPGLPVQIQVNIAGLPAEGGPFPYHVHDQPVPPDGNCTKTLAHLDPFIRGEKPPCNPKKRAKCQVGDLSGKYGFAEGQAFSANYAEVYLSLVPGVGDFIGNRSIVFHYANLTRITCANFVRVTPEIPNVGKNSAFCPPGAPPEIPNVGKNNAFCPPGAPPAGTTPGLVTPGAGGIPAGVSPPPGFPFGTIPGTAPLPIPTRAAGNGAGGANATSTPGVNVSTPVVPPTPTTPLTTGPPQVTTAAAARNRIGGAVVAIAMAAALF
ncbi:superoxide dismutase [Phyllosticta citrichinensis]|uniref:Superoxide dismutase n=1 Tax=Phyllosticta citrichinensis TaxID=1130410 RepID=A0ABR1XUS5_9PEZI